MSLFVTEYNSYDEILTLQEEWDIFVECNGQDIFMTFDWCRIWWKYYGKDRKLRVFIFRESDQIVGIMPLFEESISLGLMKVRVLKPIGSDFTLSQIILPLNKRYTDQIVLEFSEIMSKNKWDIIYLGPCSGLFDDISMLFESLSRSFENTSLKRVFDQTVFDLGDSIDDYISRLSKKERKEHRKLYNVLTENGLNVESFEYENCIGPEMDNFFDMHSRQWNEKGKAGHFGDWPLSEQFHREQACCQSKRGRLRLLSLRLNGNIVSYKYGYQVGDTLFAILTSSESESGFKVSFGRLSFYEQLRLCFRHGIKIIDSMRGFYSHKSRLGGKIRDIQAIIIVNDTLGSRFKFSYLKRIACLYNKIYYKLLYCKLFPKFNISKRVQLNKFWIRTNMFG